MTPADILFRLAGWIAPAARANWLAAMEAEYQTLGSGRLRWALGCVGVAMGWRLTKDGLYAALFCAATWFVCENPLFMVEGRLISGEFIDFGLNPMFFDFVPICLLLGIYRPRQIVFVSFALVAAMNLHDVWPRMFGEEMGPLWPYLQDTNPMNTRFLIAIWAQIGACLTGGLIGRAIAYRFRPALKAGNALNQ